MVNGEGLSINMIIAIGKIYANKSNDIKIIRFFLECMGNSMTYLLLLSSSFMRLHKSIIKKVGVRNFVFRINLILGGQGSMYIKIETLRSNKIV